MCIHIQTLYLVSSLMGPESKYTLYQFVCSAIFREYITQRWECKSTVNGKTIRADLSHLRMQTGRTWSVKCEVHCAANITGRDGYRDSWLTCRKKYISMQAAGCAVNWRNLLHLYKVGTQSFESHSSALSIHSLLGELNYIRSNLVSHLFSSAGGPETYLHEVTIEV